jgi:hypothetical protein
MICYICDKPAGKVCRKCARPYCAEHETGASGGEFCVACWSSFSGGWIFWGAVAVLGATVAAAAFDF